MIKKFSKTAYDRLPSAVRKLPKDAQTVCIFLRLRKTAPQISSATGLCLSETERLIKEVKRSLIVSGNYGMIADPVFVSIDTPQEEGMALETPSTSDNPEDSILLKNFLSVLRESVGTLSAAERRLLHLFFERRMTGGEIAGFCAQTGLGLSPDGGENPDTESEVFRAVDKAVKKLLSRMSENTPIGRGTLTVKSLKEILAHTGVEEPA